MKKKILLMLFIIFLVNIHAQEICKLESSQPFGYTGDVSGKRVYTKEEYTYNCTQTIVKKGTCKTWDIQREKLDFTGINNKAYYQSENFEGSIGEMLSVTQAYDKINGLWSGWHGLCQTGADDGNWDWISDPYVLAGYALSAVSAAAAPGVGNGMIESVGQYSSETVKHAVRMGVCAARAGLDIAKALEEYFDDGEPCDPVDEMCEEEDLANDDSNIYTIPENKYDEMILNTPDAEEYMIILDGIGTGVLTIKVVNPGANTRGLDEEEAKKAKEEAKMMSLKIQAGLTTAQTAGCVSGVSSGGGSGDSNGDMLSAQNLAVMGLGMINPLFGMAASMALNVYDSVSSDIDTCSNEDDAKAKGSRHIATLKANQNDMCHFIEKIEKNGFLSEQQFYRYCCYDDKMTRIIVEQAKAQFAKDWQHCTDITIKELEHISFSACDPTELDADVDGTKLDAYATLTQRLSAYQYTHKCIDTREYMQVMLEKFAGPDMLIDTSDMEETLNQLK